MRFKGSGTLNLTQEQVIEKPKISLTSLKKWKKIKRKTIRNLFGIQCKKKLLSKPLAWRAMTCATKQKWTFLSIQLF